MRPWYASSAAATLAILTTCANCRGRRHSLRYIYSAHQCEILSKCRVKTYFVEGEGVRERERGSEETSAKEQISGCWRCSDRQDGSEPTLRRGSSLDLVRSSQIMQRNGTCLTSSRIRGNAGVRSNDTV